jgi:VanZ family protein
VILIKNLSVPKKLFFFLALLWAGVIAFFCLVDSSGIPKISISIENLDKIVHIFFHFVLTFLLYLFFWKSLKDSGILKPIVISIFFSFSFGIIIEILQELFTTTRHADVFDVLANLFGAALSVVTIIVWSKFGNLERFLEDKV